MFLDPAKLIEKNGPRRLVLSACMVPAAGLTRFQPAGFPEVGPVLYKAPQRIKPAPGKQAGGGPADEEPRYQIRQICIVDSPASMANHLETVCLRAAHDPELAEDLKGLPMVRCSTDREDGQGQEVFVTSLTEGHRLASTYIMDARMKDQDRRFGEQFRAQCGIRDLDKKSHPLPEQWWQTFATIFRYDPNSLVHGILFPALGIKIARSLTAHLEAFGAEKVSSAGVKFDKIGKTNSGQPIFSVEEETAHEIRATFLLDLAQIRSFGRDGKGLSDAHKRLLVTLALWKVGRLLEHNFRFRSKCDLDCEKLVVQLDGGEEQEVEPADLVKLPIEDAITACEFPQPAITDVYIPGSELFKKEKDKTKDDDEDEGDEDKE